MRFVGTAFVEGIVVSDRPCRFNWSNKWHLTDKPAAPKFVRFWTIADNGRV